MSTPLPEETGALAWLSDLSSSWRGEPRHGGARSGREGALLLGAHGSSNALAVRNGVLTTASIVRTGVSDIIAQTVTAPRAARTTEGE